MSQSGRGPGVVLPPPVLFIAAYLVAWLLDHFVIHLWPGMPVTIAGVVSALGWILVIGGVGLAIWGRTTFLRMGATVILIRDAKLLVTEGPYRFSRNPMYTGIIIACVGGSAVMRSVWPLITVALATAVLSAWVIRREEHYLTAEFGDQYRAYQRQVGRWFTL